MNVIFGTHRWHVQCIQLPLRSLLKMNTVASPRKHLKREHKSKREENLYDGNQTNSMHANKFTQ